MLLYNQELNVELSTDVWCQWISFIQIKQFAYSWRSPKNCMNKNDYISNLWLSKLQSNIDNICTRKTDKIKHFPLWVKPTSFSSIWSTHFFSACFSQLVFILRVKLAAILQLSQYCTFDGDSISTVITEPGQPVISSSPTRMMNVVIIRWSTKNIRHINIRHIRERQSNNASF